MPSKQFTRRMILPYPPGFDASGVAGTQQTIALLDLDKRSADAESLRFDGDELSLRLRGEYGEHRFRRWPTNPVHLLQALMSTSTIARYRGVQWYRVEAQVERPAAT